MLEGDWKAGGGEKCLLFPICCCPISVAPALQLYLGIQSIILGTKCKEADISLTGGKGVPPYILCPRHLTCFTLVPALKTFNDLVCFLRIFLKIHFNVVFNHIVEQLCLFFCPFDITT